MAAGVDMATGLAVGVDIAAVLAACIMASIIAVGAIAGVVMLSREVVAWAATVLVDIALVAAVDMVLRAAQVMAAEDAVEG